MVLYLGTLSWQPNIEGVERFVSGVFPAVHKRVPECAARRRGPRGATRRWPRRSRPQPARSSSARSDDIEALYKTARVFVDATRSGGGTRLKVLNALARGVPVVASEHAAQGLDIVAGEHLIVARNDQAMADAVVDLLQQRARAGRSSARTAAR